MIVILITASSMTESRFLQDSTLLILGKDRLAPILFVEYVATRTPDSVTVFSNRLLEYMMKVDTVNFVLCEDPVEEAMRRARY
jgi:hypothetical protein